MPLLPEPIVRCPKCHVHIADIDPRWVAEYDTKTQRPASPWSYMRRKILDAWREFGHLKGWMTQGECPEKDCDGRWWDPTSERLTVAVPRHVRQVAEDERRRRELHDDPGNKLHQGHDDDEARQGDLAEGERPCLPDASA